MNVKKSVQNIIGCNAFSELSEYVYCITSGTGKNQVKRDFVKTYWHKFPTLLAKYVPVGGIAGYIYIGEWFVWRVLTNIAGKE